MSSEQLIDIESHGHCLICTRDDKSMCELPCKHFYCNSCIQRWLTYKDTCPVCRRITTKAEIQKFPLVIITKKHTYVYCRIVLIIIIILAVIFAVGVIFYFTFT